MQMKTVFFFLGGGGTSKRTLALHLEWIFPTGLQEGDAKLHFFFFFEVCH